MSNQQNMITFASTINMDRVSTEYHIHMDVEHTKAQEERMEKRLFAAIPSEQEWIG